MDQVHETGRERLHRIGYEGSLALRFEGFDIWDVHPANVLLSPEGLPLPVDVIVTRSPS